MLPFVFFCFVFVNDKASTDSYHYWHKLSLHDALPIFLGRRGDDRTNTKGIGGVVYDLRQQRRRPLSDQPAVRAIQQHCTYSGVRVRQEGIGLLAREFHRSEEHTSELQSLMRISYAVFCLKKK